MTKLLLSVHVLAAIVSIGPVAVAASMFPPAARAALAAPGDGQAAGIARVLYRICGVYSALGLVAVVFGFFTAQSLGVLGQGWLIAAIALTGLAALVLALAVLPTQRDLIDEITAAGAPTADPAAEGRPAGTLPAGTLPAGAVSVALARSRRLAMSVGVFNLLWVAVTVLMIVRPGSTTGA
ncbi:protease [Frankia sp. AgB32]|uniref:protease n=1 Tax=Frankia sp. AgB32 TaxID=631119 RepID=UPI00200D6076|nr:protease [Frankia sp. AgB32]MCK9895513.1 protease [Frankia sp. AgB32]